MCHPFPWVTAGSFQGKPLSTQSQSTSGSVRGWLRYSRNPQGSISPGPSPGQQSKSEDKAVGYTSTSLTWCPDILGSNPLWTIAFLSLCLPCRRLANPTKSQNKAGEKSQNLFVEVQKLLKGPTTAKNAIAQTGAHTPALKSHWKAPTMLISELLPLWNEWQGDLSRP